MTQKQPEDRERCARQAETEPETDGDSQREPESRRLKKGTWRHRETASVSESNRTSGGMARRRRGKRRLHHPAKGRKNWIEEERGNVLEPKGGSTTKDPT